MTRQQNYYCVSEVFPDVSLMLSKKKNNPDSINKKIQCPDNRLVSC